MVVSVNGNLLLESYECCAQPYISRALGSALEFIGDKGETLAFKQTLSIIILSWRKEIFSQDSGFR